MKKILIITDAYNPQINGVVTTMNHVIEELKKEHEVMVIEPSMFKLIPFNVYTDVKLAIPYGLEKMMKKFDPDYIHIVTEFTLGIAANYICCKNKWNFTTAYHTKFPEYAKEHFRLPVNLGYAILRNFHNKSKNIMVATKSLHEQLITKRFKRLAMWNRGVDTVLFDPSKNAELFKDYEKPILLNVGRVSYEKNIDKFLDTKVKGTKVIVGDGPALKDLKNKYKDVVFLGAKKGEELASIFASADCFVFPSLTDTFGLVILEALASGLPVAAYNVTGPKDILNEDIGCLTEDNLTKAIEEALLKDKRKCRDFALNHSWKECANKFLSNLVHI